MKVNPTGIEPALLDAVNKDATHLGELSDAVRTQNGAEFAMVLDDVVDRLYDLLGREN